MSEITASDASSASPAVELKAHARVVYRHTLWVRSWHWINAFVLIVLVMSGLQIFNAHPSLDWGMTSNFDHPWVALDGVEVNGRLKGVTTIAGYSFETTGVLGVAPGPSGKLRAQGVPGWATLPHLRNLGVGRHYHFLSAWIFVLNGLAFVAYTLWSGHLVKDLWPSHADLRSIPSSIWAHVRLRHATGDAARRYNVLQKLAYLAVLYGLLPLMLATGLTMSPGMNAAFPDLLWIFGGRQSARTLHFLSASGLVLFFLVHIFEVVVSGPVNELRSIITGWFSLSAAPPGRGE